MLPAPRRLCVLLAQVTSLALLAALAPGVPAQAASGPERISRSAQQTVTMQRTDGNARGEVWAIWVALHGSRYVVETARQSPKGRWSEPLRLAGPFRWRGTWAGWPDIGVDERGVAVAVWGEPKGRGATRIRTSTFRPDRGWGKRAWLSSRGDPAGFPFVEVSRRGHAVVQWAGNTTSTFSEPTTLMTSYRGVKGGWEAPQRLDLDPAFVLDARAGDPAIDDSGRATIAWDETNPGEAGVGRIRAATRAATGPWVAETIFQNVDRSDQPHVATTPGGRLLAVWSDLDATYGRFRTPDGAWGPVETVRSYAGHATNIHGVGVTEAGLAAVYVQDVQTAGSLVQPTVVVQSAPGAAWVPEAVDAPAPRYYISVFESQLALTERGAMAVTWPEQVDDLDQWYDAYLATRTPTGAWSPQRRIGRFASDLRLAVDGRSRLSVVYGEGYRYRGREYCCERLMALRSAIR